MIFARGNGKPSISAVQNINHMLEIDEILKKDAKQFATEMASIRDKYSGKNEDEEARHIEMDELMCATLCRLGFHEGVRIFEDTKKWWA